MKKIAKKFRKYGFVFEQVKRVGNVAIYKQYVPNTRSLHYEIVKIGSHNGYYLGGQKLEATETYPGASLWGLQGWTCTTMERAEEQYKLACTRFNKELVVA